jgi:hypothetical protein
MTTAIAGSTLALDRFMDRYDFTRCETLVVEGASEQVYECVRTLDFLSVHNPLMDAAMWMRGLPAKIKGEEMEPPPSMRLVDLFETETSSEQPWTALAEEPGSEFVFGTVGKFWQADIEWNPEATKSFAEFHEPGWGKIAASISVHPYGTHRSIVVYEARTSMTDAASRRRFGRYWRLVSPFIGVVMRALLDEVARRAETAPSA